MPREFDRMVKAIKRSGSKVNPYAVARSKLGTDAEIIARRSGKMKRNSPPEHHALIGCGPKPGWDKGD